MTDNDTGELVTYNKTSMENCKCNVGARCVSLYLSCKMGQSAKKCPFSPQYRHYCPLICLLLFCSVSPKAPSCMGSKLVSLGEALLRTHSWHWSKHPCGRAGHFGGVAVGWAFPCGCRSMWMASVISVSRSISVSRQVIWRARVSSLWNTIINSSLFHPLSATRMLKRMK